MNDGDAFLLDVGKAIYVWNGLSASGTEKRKVRTQCFLHANRSAGVALEANLRNPLHAGDKACKRGDQPWLWNPDETSLKVRNRGISSPPQKGLMSSKNLKKRKVSFMLSFKFQSLNTADFRKYLFGIMLYIWANSESVPVTALVACRPWSMHEESGMTVDQETSLLSTRTKKHQTWRRKN